MNHPQNSVETISLAFGQQRELLARADVLVSAMTETIPASLEEGAAMAELEQILNEADRRSSQFPAFFSALSQAQRTDPGMQGLIDSLAGDIAGMISKLDQLAGQAVQARNRLLPEFDQSVRIRQMQNAYLAAPDKAVSGSRDEPRNDV